MRLERAKKSMSPREQRIRYEGIRKVIKPWCDDKDELDALCTEAMMWSHAGNYDQRVFFHHVIDRKLSTFVYLGLATEEGRTRILSMIKSTDSGLNTLGMLAIKSMANEYKVLRNERKI